MFSFLIHIDVKCYYIIINISTKLFQNKCIALQDFSLLFYYRGTWLITQERWSFCVEITVVYWVRWSESYLPIYYVRWSESFVYVVLTKVYYVRWLYTAFNPGNVVLTCCILHKLIFKICIKSSLNVVLTMAKVRWSNPALNPLNYGMFSNFIISCIESSVNVVLTNIYCVRWSYPAFNPLNNWYSSWCTKEDDHFLHLILYLCSTHNGI